MLAGTAAAGAASAPTLDPCPATASITPVYDVSAAADGAFGAIKRLFPRMNYAQGRTTPVTRKTTVITEVVALSRTSADALSLRQLAARRCGASTARLSWGVVARFPFSAMATTSQIAVVVVDTRRGWKLYRTVLDHD